MTDHLDAKRGRDIVARWCSLAEQRLEYLTELFESGRWRRFHSEVAFLENIQEAKTAVKVWRDLSKREASRDNSAVDMSWLGRTRKSLPRVQSMLEEVHRLRPQQAEISAEPPASIISIVPKTDNLCLEQAPVASAADHASALRRDISATITERYPLLRNAL